MATASAAVPTEGLDDGGEPRDVFVDGMDFVEASYTGTTKQGRLEGHGTYTFSNGSVYRGGFLDGQFHGHGTITFPNGQVFEADWEHGKSRGVGSARGELTFRDGLVYVENDWDYCDADDRRFYSERVNGLKPAGDTSKTDAGEAPAIPLGSYDVGDGYFVPSTCEVLSYDHQPLRTPSPEDAAWIVKHCRIGTA